MRTADKLKKASSRLNAGGVPSAKRVEEAEMALSTRGNGARHGAVLLKNITLNPNNLWNSEDGDEDIAQLADAIRRSGLLHNIVVSEREDGTLLLLSGERRVRAQRLLWQEENARGEESKRNKWERIQAEIITGLDEIDEMILLDEANIMARGAAADAATMTRCIGRYVENLQKKYDLNQSEAESILRKKTTMARATVFRYLKINHDLTEPLGRLLEAGKMSFMQGVALAGLTAEEQQEVSIACEAAVSLSEGDEALADKYLSKVLERAVRAAEEADKGIREEKLAALTEGLVEVRPEKPVQTADEALRTQKAKYIGKYDKFAAELRKLSGSKRKMRTLCQLENADEDSSIIESLENLDREVRVLLAQLRGK